jgi:hypothetical protein
MTTIDRILSQIRAVKTCSRAQLYRYLAQAEVSPVGIRQRPRLYPDDTADRILRLLGTEDQKPIVSMKQLRAIRSRGQKVGAK